MTRELPKVVTLTDAAADRVKEIMSGAEEGYVGVRVGVKTRAARAWNTPWTMPPKRDPLTKWWKTKA